MKKITVLMTGATGFLGNHILEALMANENIKIIAACHDKSKLLHNFNGEVRLGDLTDKSYIAKLTQGVDVICHAAAWVSLWIHRKEEQRNYRDPTLAFLLATIVDDLTGFESFNICGTAFPTMREVINFIHYEIGTPQPHFGVPLWRAYVFAWLMEKINFLLPGDSFLTRAIVFLGED